MSREMLLQLSSNLSPACFTSHGLALPLSIFLHQSGEPGLFFAPFFWGLYCEPSMST